MMFTNSTILNLLVKLYCDDFAAKHLHYKHLLKHKLERHSLMLFITIVAAFTPTNQ
jgi:hypothetical protein